MSDEKFNRSSTKHGSVSSDSIFWNIERETDRDRDRDREEREKETEGQKEGREEVGFCFLVVIS